MPTASLATVHAVYAADAASTGGVALSGISLAELLGDAGFFGVIIPVSVPAVVTEHLTAGPGVYWSDQYFQSQSDLGGGQTGPIRSYPAGSVATAELERRPAAHAARLQRPGERVRPGRGERRARSRPPGSAGRSRSTSTRSPTTPPGTPGPGTRRGYSHNIGSISGSYLIDDNGKKLQSGKISPSIGFGPLRRRGHAARRAVDGRVHAHREAGRPAVPAVDRGHRHLDLAVGRRRRRRHGAVELVLRRRLAGVRGPAAADLRLPGGGTSRIDGTAARRAGRGADQRRPPGADGRRPRRPRR